MKVSTEEQLLLALSKREVRVLNHLESHGMGTNMQQLMQIIKSPRTTLNWTLQQLQKRGLVYADQVGREKIWYSNLRKSLIRSQGQSLTSIAGGMEVGNGTAEIIKMYEIALSLHKRERVIIIEGKQAAVLIAQKAGIPFIIQWHTIALEKELIMESIVTKDTVLKIKSGEIDKKVVESLSRFNLWVGYAISNGLLHSSASILLFRDSLILVDWKTERCVSVHNREIISIIKEMAEGYKTFATQVDMINIVKNAH
jgi:predicted transcriptional regulator